MMHDSHTRFFLLLGWCCLLTVAVLIMAVPLIIGTNTKNPKNGATDRYQGLPEDGKGSSPSNPNHIHLVSRGDSSWMTSDSCFCPNTSLHLQEDNRAVEITVEGFYYAHAQVTFRATNGESKVRVTLIANENVLDKMARKLSEAEQNRQGSVFMSNVIHLKKGERVQLSISNGSMTLLRDESQTYWGLFLLAQHE